jgi:hypothetical protein
MSDSVIRHAAASDHTPLQSSLELRPIVLAHPLERRQIRARLCGLISVTTSAGLVMNQSTPARAMNAAAPIAARPFMVISVGIQACASA